MADEFDPPAADFNQEVPPPTRPRDQAGKFIKETPKPEPLFKVRAVEGDPETGDTSDGGDDQRLRSLEREVADGGERYGLDEGGKSAKNLQNLRRSVSNTEEDEPEQEVERIDEPGDELEEQEPADEEGQGQRYEITVDGKPVQVTLDEALRGYIRQQTFHRRMTQLNSVQAELETEVARIQQNWALWHQARKEYEEDVANMMPREPDWDAEFAKNPAAAHQQQKIFQQIYARLNASIQARNARQAEDAVEQDRRVKNFAINGFNQFVEDEGLHDEAIRKKELQSMRRTALAAGFSEQEVSSVYDPRMLKVLRKASRFDRMTATRPKAVVTGKGRTLAPGAATPLGGNARRSGTDEAARQLARTGRIDDATEWFRKVLT